jgi:ankyrin
LLLLGRPDTIHRATIRLTDIANLLDKDWESLAEELNIPPNDVALIKQEYPDQSAQQAAAMFKIWQSNENKATGESTTDDVIQFIYFLYSGINAQLA